MCLLSWTVFSGECGLWASCYIFTPCSARDNRLVYRLLKSDERLVYRLLKSDERLVYRLLKSDERLVYRLLKSISDSER